MVMLRFRRKRVVIGRRIQILRPRTYQLLKPTRLIVALESMWRVPTTLWVYILSTIPNCSGAGGLSGRLDRELHQGARPEFDWGGARLGSLRCTNSTGLPTVGSVVRRQRWDSSSAGQLQWCCAGKVARKHDGAHHTTLTRPLRR